ncbi:membrane protein [Streptomyces thermoviolaceus subsp. apingens]|nr:membrane protein [Streptomyces thermoviolaceus subsp. apingens]
MARQAQQSYKHTMLWVLLLLSAWGVAGAACAGLCLAAVRAAAEETDGPAAAAARIRELTLYEAAFLSGGPVRVVDVTLLAMARQRRLLLAYTGWATVVDPRGRDEMERSVIGAIGPGGQSRIAPLRAAAAAADAVRGLADRLVRAGLAVPEGTVSALAAGIRRVRIAAGAVAVLGAAAVLLPGPTGLSRPVIALWFALPLTLALSCLVIARIEAPPYRHRASRAGLALLSTLPRQAKDAGDERSYLARVAVRGIRAIGEPELRAAFTHRDQPWRE